MKIFVQSLTEDVRPWFRALPENSIGDPEALYQTFLNRGACNIQRVLFHWAIGVHDLRLLRVMMKMVLLQIQIGIHKTNI